MPRTIIPNTYIVILCFINYVYDVEKIVFVLLSSNFRFEFIFFTCLNQKYKKDRNNTGTRANIILFVEFTTTRCSFIIIILKRQYNIKLVSADSLIFSPHNT